MDLNQPMVQLTRQAFKTNDLYDTVGFLSSEIDFAKLVFNEVIEDNTTLDKKIYIKKFI